MHNEIVKQKRRAFSIKEREKILEKTNFKCAHCGKVLDLHTATVEHIFPLDKGGTDEEYNLVALCSNCNSTKSNMVYNIRDFYKYIDSKYVKLYTEELDRVIKNALNPKKRIMAEDVRLYRAVNPLYMPMIAKIFKRNRAKAMQMVKDSSIVAKYELAFEAEAEEISTFLNKLKTKGDYSGTLYDNEYKIKELIKYGQVYTFRLPDKSIKGVVGLFNLVRNKEDIPVQIVNIAEANDQTVLHLVTLFAFDTSFCNAYNLIERDLFNDFIVANLKLIVFKETQEAHSIMRYSDKIINMPFRFRSTDGYIQCYTGPGDREATEKIKSYYSDMEEQDNNE